MKQVNVYELGDKLKVIAKPYGGAVAVGTVVTVVEYVLGSRWIDTATVQLFELNKGETNGYQFELQPRVMKNSDFEVGQVVKCVAVEGFNYGLSFRVDSEYTVGIDRFGDTGPLDIGGYTLRANEDKTKFVLVTPAPVVASEPSELEKALTEIALLQSENTRSAQLIFKQNEEILQLRGVIGKVEDILSGA